MSYVISMAITFKQSTQTVKTQEEGLTELGDTCYCKASGGEVPMSNQHPTKDMIKTPHTPSNIIEIRRKVQHLDQLLEQMKLAYEGYLLCNSYKRADISSRYYDEAISQQNAYLGFFSQAYEALESIWHHMMQLNREGQ